MEGWPGESIAVLLGGLAFGYRKACTFFHAARRIVCESGWEGLPVSAMVLKASEKPSTATKIVLPPKVINPH